MGIMSDRLDSMVVQAVSPDRKIEATLVNRDQVSLRFGAATYRRYGERTLGHQLTKLLALLWAEYRRGYLRALSEATGETVRGDEKEYDPRRRRFQEARLELVARGVSADGWVGVESRGLVHWQVTVRDGAVRRLTEEQFLAEAREAVTALLVDYRVKLVSLKDEFFDLEIPGRKHSGQQNR